MAIAMSRTLIVLPAFNEAESVGAVIAEIKAVNPTATCLVVNDGSQDETTEVAVRAGAIVAELPFNLGVGGAMRTGFRWAVENGFDAVVQVDADGQHDPTNIVELVSQLSEYDLVIGARFAGKGNYEVSGPRKWAMQALSSMLTKFAKTKLTDTTSGFRASGPRALKLFADHYPSEYLGDTIESLVIAVRSGLLVTQVPVTMRPRMGGTPSHNPVKAAFFLLRAVIALFVAMIRTPLSVTERHSE